MYRAVAVDDNDVNASVVVKVADRQTPAGRNQRLDHPTLRHHFLEVALAQAAEK